MKSVFFGLIAAMISLNASAHDSGLITKPSKYSYQETQSRLEAALKEKGMTLFAKVDHTEGATQVGLKMLPETVTIFGNPKGGTPFMVSQPLAAIDFPLKALVWEDSHGKVFLSYNTLDYITHRHKISDKAELTKKLDGVLAAIAKAATE
jgi:uncharacterized protein (DUF302 family)